jgi:hypothetical protein
MKKYTNRIQLYGLFALIGILFFSCQDELEITETKDVILKKEGLINGRFSFSSKESLKQTIEEFKNDDISVVENKFEKYYDDGFRSLKPIINPNNEKLISQFAEEYSQKTKNEFSKKKGDKDDGFIPDPFFAALINDDNEIIVSDSIYKFSKNKGLFFAHVKDSTHLIEYVNNLEDTNLSSKLSIAEQSDICAYREEYGGITQIDDEISMYVAPIEDDCSGGGGGSSGGGSSGGGSIVLSEEELNDIINNLPICSGTTNWINNLFGKSYWCNEHFDSRHRIKTEFWDKKWFIYASVGILAKTQVKTLGIYWASESDEIHIGINRILLRYNFKKPDLKFLSHPNMNYNLEPLYLYDGEYHVESQIGSNFFVNTELEVTKNNIPFFDFGASKFLNIYIRKLPYMNDYNIASQSNIKALYNLGINYLKKTYNTGKTFAVVFQKDADQIEVLYFGDRIEKTNNNEVKKIFYSDVSFLISTTWSDKNSPTGNWNYTIKAADENFRNYTYYELDFYGLAKRGDKWRGSRMVR